MRRLEHEKVEFEEAMPSRQVVRQRVPWPRAFRAFHASFNASFADICVNVERTVEEGDLVSAWCGVTATHRESGTPGDFLRHGDGVPSGTA